MTDLDQFERRLDARLTAHVAGSVRPFDPEAITQAARGRGGLRDGHAVVPGPWRIDGLLRGGVPVLVVMLLLLAAAIGVVGAVLRSWPTTVPSLFDLRPAGSLLTPRCGATAVSLADGRALVVGGWGIDGQAVTTAEVYDPVTDMFHAAAGATSAADGSSATLMRDGRVLIAGGRRPAMADGDPDACRAAIAGTDPRDDVRDAWVFDPVTERIEPLRGLNVARSFHAAVVLPTDRILLIGGAGVPDGAGSPRIGRYGSMAEVFDPTAGTFTRTGMMFTPTGSWLGARRWQAATTILSDGRVLVTAWDPRRDDAATASPGPEPGPLVFDPLDLVFREPAEALASVTEDAAAPIVLDTSCAELCVRRYQEATGMLSEPVIHHRSGSDRVADPRAWAQLDGERLVAVDGGRVTFIDVATGEAQVLESRVAPDRVAAAGAVLRDGRVLVVGGLAGDAGGEPRVLAQAEVIIQARRATSR